MGHNSSIEWTDHTFNPWWGCTHVSPGCENCYAEKHALRFAGKIWGKGKPRRLFGDDHWAEPERWNAKAQHVGRRARVFCASMADVFDADGPESERQKLWQLIERTPWLDWLLLTKRPELSRRFLPPEWLTTPRPNLWIGVSVEDRRRKDRIDVLRNIPAVVRFLSVEPLLEDLGVLDLTGVHWVITGGESGPGARPMNAAWVRDIRDQCVAAGVSFFFKQWGKFSNNPDPYDPTTKENGGHAKGGCTLDRDAWVEMPGRNNHRDHSEGKAGSHDEK